MANGPGTSWGAGVPDAVEEVAELACQARVAVTREGESFCCHNATIPGEVETETAATALPLSQPEDTNIIQQGSGTTKHEPLSNNYIELGQGLTVSTGIGPNTQASVPLPPEENSESVTAAADHSDYSNSHNGRIPQSGHGDGSKSTIRCDRGNGGRGQTTSSGALYSLQDTVAGRSSDPPNTGGGSDAVIARSAPQLLSLGANGSVLEYVSREVIRKLRLASSAGSAEDRHVVCEELFADITCAVDASAQAALLGPGSGGTGNAAVGVGKAVPADGVSEPASGAGNKGTGVAECNISSVGEAVLPPGRRSRARGLLYYEVLAVYYASRAASDSARALLHLCQLLWDTPWVAPIYALLMHRFLLLPRDKAASASVPNVSSASVLTASRAVGNTRPSSASASSHDTSNSDPRVKHLNVLAHGARQLLLGDVHSGLSRFQPLWAFLAHEVAGLPPQPAAGGNAARREGAMDGGGGGEAARMSVTFPLPLPPVTTIDELPLTARPWLLAVVAAFLPYYCVDEQVAELSRRFPPPLPIEGAGALLGKGFGAVPTAGSAATGAATPPAVASLAGLDFLIVEMTDVLSRINSEAGLLNYLRALRALARPPRPPPPISSSSGSPSPPPHGPIPVEECKRAVAAVADEEEEEKSVAYGAAATATSDQGAPRRADPRARRPLLPPPPLAGLPTITKLRLQSELYSLTSGGGPRYAPPEVQRAAFAALDALFPGGRFLRWFVRWASRTLHLDWLEGDSGSDDARAGRGWLSWIYWPIHWCMALYGRILLGIFQLIYGMVVWRPGSHTTVAEIATVTGTGGTIHADGYGAGGVATAAAVSTHLVVGAAIEWPEKAKKDAATAVGGATATETDAAGLGAGLGRPRAGPWWQPRLRGPG